MDSTADVKGGVVAYLQVDGATKAAEFYSRAFGAQVVAAHPWTTGAAPCPYAACQWQLGDAVRQLSEFPESAGEAEAFGTSR
jgi:uncharacterized glyoxalase superfamily protein PhnB